MYDVIIIGSGPSGLMCASQIKNKKVLLIESNKNLGKKMLVSGGGRCNITNLKQTNELIKNYKNGKFLYSAFSNFNPYDIYYFFEDHNIPLKEEDHNRIFPKSDNSLDFINLFEKLLKKNNVELILNTTVTSLIIKDDVVKGVKFGDKEIYSKKVVLATGGKSFEKLGTKGFGFDELKKHNHNITELYPCESPLKSNDYIIKKGTLQGITLDNAAIKINSLKYKEAGYGLLITHFGLSGPLAMRVSEKIYFELKKTDKVNINIDFCNNTSIEELIEFFKNNKTNKDTKNAFKGVIQSRVLEYMLNELSLLDKRSIEIKNQELIDLANLIKNYPININGVFGFDKAYVTGGGVDLKEVNPKTFESKKIKNLYIIGELLDIHAHTGGYNITACLSMGFNCGNML